MSEHFMLQPETPPHSVILRILDGIHPVQAIRVWRGFEIAELAQSTGIGADLLAEIEDGREATAGENEAIAAALRVKAVYLVNHQDDSSEIGDDEISW